MDLLRAWLDLWIETAQREAFYSTYVAVVGSWFSYMGVRGLVSKETRAFGWNAGTLTGDSAARAGAIWLALGASLLLIALGFKLT